MKKEIFVIQEAWTDVLENEISNAFGYEDYSFVETEEEAKEFCKSKGFLTNKDCWAISGRKPRFIYKKISKEEK